MLHLPQIAISHPRKTIAVAVGVTLAMAPWMLQLKLRTDGHALVPPDAPEVVADARIRAEFGLDDPIAVVVCAPGEDGIINTHTVRLIHRLTGEFQQLSGARPERVFSIATETSDRVFPGTLRFRKLLEPMPATDEELARMLPVLRSDLHAIQLYDGTFISEDRGCAAILIGAPSGEDRLDLLSAIHARIAALGPTPERIDIVGAPVAEALLGTHILEDLGVPTRLLGFRTFSASRSEENSAVPDRLLGAREFIARHVGLVPVALVIMAAVFLICFRSPAAAVLPLVEVGAALIFVFGLMGFLDVPVYLTTAVLPIILTATGITDEIHVFSCYRRLLRERPDIDHVAVVRMTMAEMTRPVMMTAITTGVGFLSFAFSSIGPVQAFGVFTGVGSLFCMLWSITVVPAMFVLLSPRHFIRGNLRVRGGEGSGSRLFAMLGGLVMRFRWAVLILAAVAVVLMPSGVRRVAIQDSWIEGFAEGSEFRADLEHFNRQFLGMHTLLLHVNAGRGQEISGLLSAGDFNGQSIRFRTESLPRPLPDVTGWRMRLESASLPVTPQDGASRSPPAGFISWVSSVKPAEDGWSLELIGGRPLPAHALRLGPADAVRFELSPAPLMQPAVLDRLAALQRFVGARREDAVGGVLGPSDYISTVQFMRHARAPERRRVPQDAARVELLWNDYATTYGAARLRQLVDEAFSQGIITVLLKDANFIDTARLMAAIRAYEAEHLAPHGISLTFAGDVAVSQSLISAIVRTETQSLVGTLVGVLLITIILGRSLSFGILCIIPSSIAVLANFAFMGWTGIPLGVATSMFSAMTLGIGVDFAIHLQSRYRRVVAEGPMGFGRDQALAAAVAATGPAIMVDTLAVALGFGTLVLSQVPANARLGALVGMSIVVCFLATVIVLPALLRIGTELRRYETPTPDRLKVTCDRESG